MKFSSAIFLLVLLVSIQTPVGQFFKLPILSSHFIKHQKKEGVSFIAFLADHYSSDHNDTDSPEDEQLPFKNITFFAMGYAIMPYLIKTNLFITLSSDRKLILSETYLLSQHLGSIFHPPKA